jgi:diketogulonate reductase-like aldo/keto reductase
MGFGTYKYQVSHETSVEMISKAAQIGYRLFDTASLYMNEQGLGQALRNQAFREKTFLLLARYGIRIKAMRTHWPL